MVARGGAGGRLTAKEHEKIFWAVGNVRPRDCGGGSVSGCIY